MRILVLVVTLALAANAQAQSPGGNPPYPSPYQPEPPTSQPAPASALAQEMLDRHNAVRARVGVPPLSWSDSLAQTAQDWADYLIATNALFHSPDNRYGENLYGISGGTASPSDVVSFWAQEAAGYDIRRDTCRGVCGHYTQLVWRNTRELGCAAATNAARQVWVCEYSPPGNIVGFRPY
ncbi:MAG TPA: CAP domain-containing protein [Acetobacteraceae bacterium]|jgi:pathogenesis-related protein 1|nr:CAP domain-containing protein [Acetobacteraceae bacterium]